MYKELLDKAEVTRSELLIAYEQLNKDRDRFQAILGVEATGAEVTGLLKKYGPMVLKYTTAGGAGAGVLAGLGNVFPSIAKIFGG